MIVPIKISSADDPRIEPYMNLKDRDLRALASSTSKAVDDPYAGHFMAEGLTVVEKALSQSLYPIVSVLVAENRADRVITEASRQGYSGVIYVAPQNILNDIVGFDLHRGILALGRRLSHLNSSATALDGQVKVPGTASLVLVLCGIANHDNMGGVFRNAAAFGVDQVLMDESSCDPLYRKAIRVSVGASLLVPYGRFADQVDLATHLTTLGYACIGLDADGDLALSELKPYGPTALFLGAEGHGLPAQLAPHLTPVSIPMQGGFDSLNVATASGIALHHLFASRRQ